MHSEILRFLFQYVSLIWVASAVAQPRSIQMRQGSPFKVALFADLHFGENAWTDWGPLQDVHSIQVISSVLDKEKPVSNIRQYGSAEFVIYLGDVITANNIPIANASVYWELALSPTRNRGIPWASVFGNHDDAHFEWPGEWFSGEGIPPLNCSSSGNVACIFIGTSRLQLMKHEIGSKTTLSFSQKGPRNLWPSVSNYVVKITSSHNSELPVAYLYFLDSGGGSYPEVISYAQVKWFNRTSQQLNPNARVPEIVFWHIPTRAYNTVAPLDLRMNPCVGSINLENVTIQTAEHGIMDALAARSSVQAVFVGHNHGLDWCCPYEHLWLCFARHTGYGGYGSWARGARILEITEQPLSLKSWITMEDGSVHSEVILKS